MGYDKDLEDTGIEHPHTDEQTPRNATLNTTARRQINLKLKLRT